MSITRIRQLALVAMLTSILLTTSVAAELKFIWQAEVQSEQINVYPQVSTENPVVMVLKKGDFLNVVLEVSVSPDRWCRVAVPGQPQPAGYVLCKELIMRRFDSKQPANDAAGAIRSLSPGNVASVPATSSNTAPKLGILNNKDISEMAGIGLPAEVLIAKIKSSTCDFDTAPPTLKYLKTAGIPDTVILAMIEAPHGEPRALNSASVPQPTVSQPSSPVSSPVSAVSDGKTRVLVTDSQSWESRGGSSGGGNRNGWASSSSFSGGARPQTAEIIKTLNERCPQITVTNRLEKADFVLTLDHEGGKALLARHNKIAVFNKDGDVIFSKSTISLGNSVKDACQVMSEAKK
jgi:uncharacterized membrane protein YgcG